MPLLYLYSHPLVGSYFIIQLLDSCFCVWFSNRKQSSGFRTDLNCWLTCEIVSGLHQLYILNFPLWPCLKVIQGVEFRIRATAVYTTLMWQRQKFAFIRSGVMRSWTVQSSVDMVTHPHVHLFRKQKLKFINSVTLSKSFYSIPKC